MLAAGTFLVMVAALALYSSRSEPTAKRAPAIVFRPQREHPVTPEMLKVARKQDASQAPDFGGVDTEGRWWTLKTLTKGRPLVLYFIELECPCCKGAKGYLDRLQNYYGDKANIVGVINADAETARIWRSAVTAQFRVMADPDLRIIRAYKAQRGVYTTLVDANGRIVKAYPGYSQSMLHELASRIEALTGTPPRNMPVAPAPKTLTSGCLFPGTPITAENL